MKFVVHKNFVWTLKKSSRAMNTKQKMWGLVPTSVRSRKSFVQRYRKTHARASERDAHRKYEFAMRCMFGMDPPDENPRKQRRTESAGAGGASINFEVSDYIPGVSDGNDMSDPRCDILPTWMNVLVASVQPIYGEIYFTTHGYRPVEIERGGAAGTRYILGVCGSGVQARQDVLRILRQDGHHPIFKSCCPFEIIVDTRTDPGTVGAGGEEAVRNTVSEFCSNTEYKIALFVKYANIPDRHFGPLAPPTEFAHVCLLIKDGLDEDGNLNLVITDPNGSYDSTLSPAELESMENKVRIEALRGGQTVNVRHAQQYQDQSAEGSCGVVSFMRMLYLVHKAHVLNSEPMLHINSPIPCVWAVFVSRLFQRAGVITHSTHNDATKSANEELGIYTLTTDPPPNPDDRNAMKEYIVREAVAQDFRRRATPTHSLSQKIQGLFNRAFPGQTTFNRAEYVWVIEEIKKRSPVAFEDLVGMMSATTEGHIDAETLLRLLGP